MAQPPTAKIHVVNALLAITAGKVFLTDPNLEIRISPFQSRHPVISVFPPTRTQAGQPADCIDWYLTTSWDTCDTIVASNSWLTKEKL